MLSADSDPIYTILIRRYLDSPHTVHLFAITRPGTRAQLPYHLLDLRQRERLVGSHELLQVHPAVFEDNVESLDQRRRVRARRSEGVAQVDNVPMLHQEGGGEANSAVR